jgi:hypothetical protein
VHTAALNEIIIRALHEMEDCRMKLEVEESGRTVASLQGQISGHKNLLKFIKDAFSLPFSMMENTGDIPADLREMEDASLEVLRFSINALRSNENWKTVLGKIEENIIQLKDHLLFRAEKSRDLDIDQGIFRAETMYGSFFQGVESEYEFRQNKAKQEAAEPSFQFDEKGPGIEPELADE